MTPDDWAGRVLLADCGTCWCGSQKPCDITVEGGTAELHLLSGLVVVHCARISRAQEKGLLEEDTDGKEGQ